MSEPSIIINGKKLVVGQAMTIRAALEKFAMDLQAEPDYGKIGSAHLARISEIRAIIFKKA